MEIFFFRLYNIYIGYGNHLQFNCRFEDRRFFICFFFVKNTILIIQNNGFYNDRKNTKKIRFEISAVLPDRTLFFRRKIGPKDQSQNFLFANFFA